MNLVIQLVLTFTHTKSLNSYLSSPLMWISDTEITTGFTKIIFTKRRANQEGNTSPSFSLKRIERTILDRHSELNDASLQKLSTGYRNLRKQ